VELLPQLLFGLLRSIMAHSNIVSNALVGSCILRAEMLIIGKIALLGSNNKLVGRLTHSSYYYYLLPLRHSTKFKSRLRNYALLWPWDGHYKSILLPADEEIMGSL
jgi:hypothetical protein